MTYADLCGPPRLLMDLALGEVSSSPFSPESIAALKFDVVSDHASQGISLMPSDEDRKNISIDYPSCSSSSRQPRTQKSISVLSRQVFVWAPVQGFLAFRRCARQRRSGDFPSRWIPPIRWSPKRSPTQSGGKTTRPWQNMQTKSSK